MRKVELVLHRTTALNFEPPTDPVAFAALKDLVNLSRAKHGDYYRISLQIPYKKRTTGYKSQNHKLNGGIMALCEWSGQDFAEIKMLIKERALKRGYPPQTDEDGEIIVNRRTGIPLPKSESDCSTVECALLIDELEQLAAEMEFVLPV
jgi:hypothetical protein